MCRNPGLLASSAARNFDWREGEGIQMEDRRLAQKGTQSTKGLRLGRQDSNLDQRIQSPVCCRYTTPQYTCSLWAFQIVT